MLPDIALSYQLFMFLFIVLLFIYITKRSVEAPIAKEVKFIVGSTEH